MPRPTHVFETRFGRAEPAQEGPIAPPPGDPRGVLLRHRGRNGGGGYVALGLSRQVATDGALEDPDLPHAVACWLWARGGRRLRLFDDKGRTVCDAPISLSELGGGGPLPERPERIVSLAPSNADLLAALSATGRLVAVEDSTDAPGTESCERLGPDLGPDLDRVGELRPDLVLSSLSVPGMERVVTGLHARGMPQIVLAPRSLAEVWADVRRVARALGEPEAGERLCHGLDEQRDDVLRLRPPGPPRKVYLEWWPRPMFSPGAACYSNDVLALAGARNVFADRPGTSVEVDAAAVREKDPEAIFVSWCGVPAHKLDPQRVLDRPGIEDVSAVRAGRVYALDEALMGRPGPNLLEAARRIAQHLRGRAPA